MPASDCPPLDLRELLKKVLKNGLEQEGCWFGPDATEITGCVIPTMIGFNAAEFEFCKELYEEIKRERQ